MACRTVPGILHPDGTLTLAEKGLPDHPVPVLVTILERDEAAALPGLGDYQPGLHDDEERLARGGIRWQ